MRMMRTLALFLLSGLTVALTIWTYYWLHAFFHDLKEVMAFGLPTTLIGVVSVIFLVDYLRRSVVMAAHNHDAASKMSIKPVLGGLLSMISGLVGGVIVNPIVFFLVFNIDWSVETALLLIIPSVTCGALAVVGGFFAIRRKRYRMALLGAMMAIPSLLFLGVPAFVFMATSRSEFRGTA